MECKHENTEELARYSVDCGLSGNVTWIRYRCKDCGRVIANKLVDTGDNDPAPTPEEKPRKKRRKKG